MSRLFPSKGFAAVQRLGPRAVKLGHLHLKGGFSLVNTVFETRSAAQVYASLMTVWEAGVPMLVTDL